MKQEPSSSSSSSESEGDADRRDTEAGVGTRQKLARRGKGQLQEKLNIHNIHQTARGVGCAQKILKVVYGRGALDVLEEFIEKVVQPI